MRRLSWNVVDPSSSKFSGELEKLAQSTFISKLHKPPPIPSTSPDKPSSLNGNTNTMTTNAVNEGARNAITKAKEEQEKNNFPEIVDPNSNKGTANQISISIAKGFLEKELPDFVESKLFDDSDFLVKIGRSILDLVASADKQNEGGEEILNKGFIRSN